MKNILVEEHFGYRVGDIVYFNNPKSAYIYANNKVKAKEFLPTIQIEGLQTAQGGLFTKTCIFYSEDNIKSKFEYRKKFDNDILTVKLVGINDKITFNEDNHKWREPQLCVIYTEEGVNKIYNESEKIYFKYIPEQFYIYNNF